MTTGAGDGGSGDPPVAMWRAETEASTAQVIGAVAALGLHQSSGDADGAVLIGYGCRLTIDAAGARTGVALFVDAGQDPAALRAALEIALAPWGVTEPEVAPPDDGLDDATRPARSREEVLAVAAAIAASSDDLGPGGAAGAEASEGAPAIGEAVPAPPSTAALAADHGGAVRAGGGFAVLTGALIIGGGLLPMLQRGDVSAFASPDSWPLLSIGVLTAIAGLAALRGDRAALGVAAALSLGFMGIQVLVLELLKLFSELSKVLGGSALLAGMGLLAWTVALLTGGATVVLALGRSGPGPGERRPDSGAGLLALLAAGAVAAGFIGVARGGDIGARIFVPQQPMVTAASLFYLVLPVLVGLVATVRPSRATFGWVVGTGWFFGALSAGQAAKVLTEGAYTFSGPPHPGDLALSVGGSVVMLLVGGIVLTRPASEPAAQLGDTLSASPAEPAAPSTGAALGSLAVLAAMVLALLGGAGAVKAGESDDVGYGSLGRSTRGSGSSSSRTTSTVRRTTTTTRPRTTTTTVRRTTTTTRPRTTTTTRPSFTFQVRSACAANCKVYLRDTPFDDLGRPADDYLADGATVRVRCVETGQSVTDGDTGATSTQWALLDTGKWVSDLYVGIEPSDGVPAC